MSYEERDNSGTLYKNTRKEKDSHPDMTGRAIVNGKPVWVSAWSKTGKNGKFLSLAFKDRDPSDKPSGKARERRQEDDDLPWE